MPIFHITTEPNALESKEGIPVKFPDGTLYVKDATEALGCFYDYLEMTERVDIVEFLRRYTKILPLDHLQAETALPTDS